MQSFVKFLVLLWLYCFWKKVGVILLSLFFFHVNKVFFGTPKRKAISFLGGGGGGVPFSNSLSALYFILHLFSVRRFEATDALIVKFQNLGKKYIW